MPSRPVIVVCASAAVAVTMLAAGCATTDGRIEAGDSIWTDLSYAEAVTANERDDRVLLVYATASWCGPCRHMERTTWRDPDVAEWLSTHGLAFKVDVDEDRELARKLEVRAMPTMIAFRDGEEFDRVVGGRNAKNLLDWLDGVREGRTDAQRPPEALQGPADDEDSASQDAVRRYTDARTLLDAGRFEEATEAYLWLWDNLLEHRPSMVGVRGSYMVRDMGRLARAHGPAMQAFQKLRARYQAAIDEGTATREETRDWVTLATAVNDHESIIEWFDRWKDEPQGLKIITQQQYRVEQLLIQRDRWADVHVLYPDPVAAARQQVLRVASLDRRQNVPGAEEMFADMRAATLDLARARIATIYAAFLTIGEKDIAGDIAQVLLDVDDTVEARRVLIERALEGNQPQREHLRWLDEADEQDASIQRLRERVAAAIAEVA